MTPGIVNVKNRGETVPSSVKCLRILPHWTYLHSARLMRLNLLATASTDKDKVGIEVEGKRKTENVQINYDTPAFQWKASKRIYMDERALQVVGIKAAHQL